MNLIDNDIAARAADGDGQHAIAYAILRLAGELNQLQKNLTFGDWEDRENRTRGVFEQLAMNVAAFTEVVREK